MQARFIHIVVIYSTAAKYECLKGYIISVMDVPMLQAPLSAPVWMYPRHTLYANVALGYLIKHTENFISGTFKDYSLSKNMVWIIDICQWDINSQPCICSTIDDMGCRTFEDLYS